LYVADTENHAIRRLDLTAGQVETVAGTGRQVYMQQTSGPALQTPLNSPWDVLFHEELLYIAMAGQHQLWLYDPAGQEVRLFAGSGREELRDGDRLEGGLNQPSGLATDGDLLFIADSEASAIRTAELDPDGELNTIVGTGLFDFGDVDGRGDEVRLQHPLGVVYDEGLLYVADTYNSKIKQIFPDTRESVTLAGSGEAGWHDGDEALFDEPGGLSLAGDTLYVADTNNHVVRLVNVSTGESSTLVLADPQGLLTRQPAGEPYSGKVVTLDEVQVAPGEGAIELRLTLPAGYKLNDRAPFSMEWQSDGEAINFDPGLANQSIVAPQLPISVPATFAAGASSLTGDLVIYYCEQEAQALCLIERVRLTVPVTVEPGGARVLVVEHTIPDPPSLDNE
jgi:sugar lactone lactonase YvrE